MTTDFADLNVASFEEAARTRVDPVAWDYIAGGSDDEVSLRENRAAFERLRLRPRVLVGVEACETATTVLGQRVASPVLVAPVAYHTLVHPEGECATARATAAADTVFTVSTMATRTLEDIAAASSGGGGALWFQVYVFRDRGFTEALVRRAEAAGCRALVLTVDTPCVARRERDLRNGFALPAGMRAQNLDDASARTLAASHRGLSSLEEHSRAHFDPSLTWSAIDWLRSITKLPLVLKGILTGEDARLAVQHGADALVVSNHGGRQLDGTVAPIDALPEVVEAVAGGCEVYVDGGVRRGTDVLKAIALGARAVMVGRPVLWGLAVDGDAGVRRVLDRYTAEYRLALMLAGCRNGAAVDRSLVRGVQPR